MRIEKSCGAVVFTRQSAEILYLIIRQTNGDWGFPKGHMEPGEKENDTALREIREEVGLTVAIADGFREEICYPFPNKPDVVKQVVYFLAEFSHQAICCQPEELTDAQLLAYDDAVNTLTFPETKCILEKANYFLTR